MKINELRSKASKDALTMYKKTGVVLLEWATAMGKTKAAIDIIKYASKEFAKTTKYKLSNYNILIVVAETSHKENWRQEFNKWNLKFNEGEITDDNAINIEFQCYQTFRKCNNRVLHNITIFDEAHHLASEKSLEALESNVEMTGGMVFLSATMKQTIIDNIADAIKDYGKLIEMSVVRLKTAIEADVIPEPVIIPVPLALCLDRNQEIILNKNAKGNPIEVLYPNRWKYIKNKAAYKNTKIIIKCNELEKYQYIEQSLSYWKNLLYRTHSEFSRNRVLQLGSERKRFLGSIKTDAARHIIDTELKDYRYICFCSSIAQSEELNKQTSINSKVVDNASLIDKFNKHETNSLYCVGMLQEGQNLCDIEAGLIIQLDKEERSFVQKMGRVLRADKPKVYIMYVKNTNDELNFNKCMEELKCKIELKFGK